MAEMLGYPLMPWQQLVADVAGEMDARSGRFAYEVVDLIVPRQAGKTLLAMATLIQRCQLRTMARCWYTSKTRQDAANLLSREWGPIIEHSRLNPAVRVRLAAGSELLTVKSQRSTIGIFPPTRTGLHGWQADTVFLDECWKFNLELGTDIETGVRPAQVTRPHRQLWRISAAGDDGSSYLDEIMRSGRELVTSGRRSKRAYFEWSAPVDPDGSFDPYDRELWWQAHPALGLTIDETAIVTDAETMDPAEFARSYLCVPSRGSIARVIGLEDWRKAVVAPNPRPVPLAFAVDISPARTAASIGVAGRRVDGRCQVEVVESAPVGNWIVRRLAELHQRWGSRIILDPAGPAGALRNELARAGVPFEEMSGRTVGQACGAFYDGVVTNGGIVHVDQPELNSALAGARKRPIGEAWGWDRKVAGVDITPLVAVTLAAWAADIPTPEDKALVFAY